MNETSRESAGPIKEIREWPVMAARGQASGEAILFMKIDRDDVSGY